VASITAIVCDFGGVLTSPLLDAFTAYQARSGIPLEALGTAMATIAQRDGEFPLHALETGRITEAAFLESLSSQLSADLGRDVDMSDFGRTYLELLEPNQPLIDYMRELRGRGYRMAICTNNVREWEAGWRAKLPVEEIFETVVDSAWVGVRKPDRRIYEITLERLGVAASETLFLDDFEHNCAAARELGMTAVHFRTNEQAIADVEAALVFDA
jgi:putative hydrolase of the HAD superfamily